MNCHQGNEAVLKKDESHQGFLSHPQKDDGAKCQECHPLDAQKHLDTFASLAGYKPVTAAALYIPSEKVEAGFPVVPEAYSIVEILPWLAGALLLFGFWLALVYLSTQKP